MLDWLLEWFLEPQINISYVIHVLLDLVEGKGGFQKNRGVANIWRLPDSLKIFGSKFPC